MQQRRHVLQIRSLLEFPALRVAMGLDQPAGTVTIPAIAEHTVATAEPARRRTPKRAPKSASAPRIVAGTATRTGDAKLHPRFDRRALLETDRVA